MEPKVARLMGNHEPVFVYLFNGVGKLHCGVCGKELLLMEEYTRHQSPTRWSLSGHVWSDVEVGLRRTSVKPYIACRQCYPFIYLDEDDRTTGQIKRAWEEADYEHQALRLDQLVETGEMKIDHYGKGPHHMLVDAKQFTQENDFDAGEPTVVIPRVQPRPKPTALEPRVWDIETEQLPAVSKEQVEEYGTGVSSKSYLEMFIDEAGRKDTVDGWLT